MLRALAGSGDSSGVSEVARTTGLAKSTCSRILASLDELGIVERVDETKRDRRSREMKEREHSNAAAGDVMALSLF